MNTVERFLRYVSYDTQSNSNQKGCPSTKRQLELGKLLVRELQDMGLSDASIDENGYVMATLQSNSKKEIPVIGFIAHMDTAPDMSGKGVKPQVVENYSGGDITLDVEKGIVLSPRDFPEMLNYKGQTIITTDGNTLLGADDKAGIAEIMSAIEHLLQNPDIEHGTIKVGFTPDEEIGRGADLFDVERFGAQYAYTIDGGEIGELEYENFNACVADIKIQGRNVHPGTAKEKMINSMKVAMEIDSMLPQNEAPEHTEMYEGFYHLIGINGSVESSSMAYIIRDHDMEKFKEKKEMLKSIVNFINKKYGSEMISLNIKDQYYNMKEKVEPVLHIVEIAKEAMEQAGVEADVKPIRGGTDGARLSYMGLPCPNIFTGGHNFHGRYEYICAQSMEKAVQVIINISKLYAQKGK
ncbi:peptidase T. Metallo peptidase. MEROPS family M20B [Peptoclostridium litorale DSM 5388]|uniref:Peptidase T n=1 Tax=Peptoclostridium litorale DSM 5388 TaxID=1121324 RepID=A0A069RIS8_PEPLI|nr:peptidase T [Peptoclostridium litorale]KDR96055.1 peptidase T [Peptoclostridium litorale DSM 5388]SIO05717.1 peptidase T. Metallo peptidase. MEROPS family M20B [Peptoclostridium litorale DSM 5388]